MRNKANSTNVRKLIMIWGNKQVTKNTIKFTKEQINTILIANKQDTEDGTNCTNVMMFMMHRAEKQGIINIITYTNIGIIQNMIKLMQTLFKKISYEHQTYKNRSRLQRSIVKIRSSF